MGPTEVVVRAWVVQGLWCMCDVHGSYRGCGACMGPTGVVTCMGPTGVVVRA